MDKYGALEKSSEFIIDQNTGGDESSINEKLESQIRHSLISQGTLWWTQVTTRNFGAYPISMPYVSPFKLKIGCLVMFLTFSEMYQDHH